MDSNTFYDNFARSYEAYSRKKNNYLFQIDQHIIEDSRNRAIQNLADVGCGDGRRTAAIANALKIKDIALIDNSKEMLSAAKQRMPSAETVLIDISDSRFNFNRHFDLILCLWNVLGHIPTETNRLKALDNIARAMNTNSVLYLDTNNRYNISHYGLKPVCKNIWQDILPFTTTGDFDLRIDAAGHNIETQVHIFNPFEIERLFRKSGLRVVERKIIDYSTGQDRPTIFQGQLLYKLKPQTGKDKIAWQRS